jgi:hypothetical protein
VSLDAFAYDRAGANDRVLADGDAVEDLGPGAEPHAVANDDPGGPPRLREHRRRRIREVMIAADDVPVRSHQDVGAERHTAGGEQLAIEADVRSRPDLDVSVLARQDRVAPDEHPRADANAAVARAFRIEQAVVVDDNVVADVNLVRVAEDHVLSENHVAAARAEQPRVQRLAQRQADRAGACLGQRHDEFVPDQGGEAGTADDERRVLRPARRAGGEKLLLRLCDFRASHVRGTTRVYA